MLYLKKTHPFYLEWKQLLASGAKTYTGLYSGMQRIADGNAKKPEKVIREWCARTENLYRESQAPELCRPCSQEELEIACARKSNVRHYSQIQKDLDTIVPFLSGRLQKYAVRA